MNKLTAEQLRARLHCESTKQKVTLEHHTFPDAIALAKRLNTQFDNVLAVRLVATVVKALGNNEVTNSPWLYLRGEKQDAATILDGTDPADETLRWNVKANNISAVVRVGGLAFEMRKGDRLEAVL